MKRGTLSTISRRAFDEVWSGDNPAAIDELFDVDYVFHDAGSPAMAGLDQFKQLLGMYRTIFANLRFEVLDEIVNGDRIATRWVATSVHAAPFAGIAPTGRRLSATGLTIDRIHDGKIVETWTNWDTLGVMQQIGAIPELAAA